jgi:hypothetical protein
MRRHFAEGGVMNRRADSLRKPLAAHIWAKDPLGFYVEPEWVSERLFAVEEFSGGIWDPSCGIGRIPESARRAGHEFIATDIVDRNYKYFSGRLDFLTARTARSANVVRNPPFDACDEFARHALELATCKVAMIWLHRRLVAARWLAETPLARIYPLTPRPSMPPGHVILAGTRPGGGTQDFAILVWVHGHAGPPEVHWLHRDGTRTVLEQVRAVELERDARLRQRLATNLATQILRADDRRRARIEHPRPKPPEPAPEPSRPSKWRPLAELKNLLRSP